MTLPFSPIGCPMDSLLRMLMGPWTTYILWILRNQGPTRFGALRRELAGISSKVLTDRVRMLEKAGVVYRDYQPTVPPKVTYGLTKKGQDLIGALDSLNEVAQHWSRTDVAHQSDKAHQVE